ncbi:hypothetical protein ADUPG1_006469 [Aduncisulcus paluster]|uniref:Reverse transcriptase zinc-binding domain-containing protein n=1 Tax=Aduncisulcus paluster TaxID=2918883 RepID=A0ABQ5KIE6_9EUKA|nr:hypothetical protein ADUPG1_006469 [Aduncisulcus paluster]
MYTSSKEQDGLLQQQISIRDYGSLRRLGVRTLQQVEQLHITKTTQYVDHFSLHSHNSAIRVHLITNHTISMSVCPLCHQDNTQTHVFGGCREMMNIYTTRHHEIRKFIAEFIRIKLQTAVREEVIEGHLRYDILVGEGEATKWLDITVTYEDARLHSIEKRLSEKKEKYGDNGCVQ